MTPNAFSMSHHSHSLLGKSEEVKVNMPSLNACTLGIVAYPRTGKRGVPQQFPRRLYEMLEGESSKIEGENCDPIIAWSDSGKAFRIIDARMFSSDVLPRYFRTSKFSSFQRNLNLVSSD